MSDLEMIPTFPTVRCDRCRRVYTVELPAQGGLINGFCPKCGNERFSTAFEGFDEQAVRAVMDWTMR